METEDSVPLEIEKWQLHSPVRMAVHSGGWAVGSPPGVSDSGVRIENLVEIRLRLLNELLQLGNFANLFESKDFIFLITVHSQTGRVVPSVLKPGQPYLDTKVRTGRQLEMKFEDQVFLPFTRASRMNLRSFSTK